MQLPQVMNMCRPVTGVGVARLIDCQFA